MKGKISIILWPKSAPSFALNGGDGFEIIMVDDCSRDDTPLRLGRLKSQFPELVALRHDKNSGQSRALRSGIMAARASIILTLDGDGQNPPAEGIALVKTLMAGPENLGLVGGERQKRQDSWAKKTPLYGPTKFAKPCSKMAARTQDAALRPSAVRLFCNWPILTIYTDTYPP